MDSKLLKLENNIIIQQKKICDKYGAPYLAASFDRLIGVAVNTFTVPSQWPINGLRHPIESEQSANWYLWAGEEFSESADFFKPMHIFHLVDFFPKVLPFLGLPPGWRFLFDDKYEDVWCDESLLNI